MSQTRSDAEDLEGSSAHIDPQDADERAAAEEDEGYEADSELSAEDDEYEEYEDGDDEESPAAGKGGTKTAARPRKVKSAQADDDEDDAKSGRKKGRRGAAKGAAKKPAAAPAPRRKRTPPGLYYRQIVAEMRKVVWPTRNELWTYTSVVIVFVLCIIGYVALVDYGVERAIQAIFG